MAGVMGYLVFALTEIGWKAIWTSLPASPWFYLIFLSLYFSLPLTEVFIYRITWKYPFWQSFPVFVKKRIYNKDVIGYSGEVYFYAWARKNVGLPDKELWKTVRDNNIISSFSSTFVAAVLLGVFLLEGQISLDRWIGHSTLSYGVGGALVFALATALAFRFRKYIFSMPVRAALMIFGIQCFRLLAGQVLQIAQWAVVIPEVSLQAWFTFSAASIIVSRIPILPNRDLLFLGAGVELSVMLDISSAQVAGMLLMTSVLNKILNVVVFAAASALDRRNRPAEPLSAPESRPAPPPAIPEPVPVEA